MDKISRAKRELFFLKKEIQEEMQKYEENIAFLNNCVGKTEQEMAQYYQDFFTKKRNKEFVLYGRYPGIDALELYVNKISSEFPLYHKGNFNIKELAILIKHFYQFKRNKDYDVLTFGVNKNHGMSLYDGQSFSLQPHLYFVVGNEKTLNSKSRMKFTHWSISNFLWQIEKCRFNDDYYADYDFFFMQYIRI